MLTTVRRPLISSALVPLACLLAMPQSASADNFGPSHYDRATDQLVVTMLYGGSNPNHTFTIKWGTCELDDSGRRMPLVNADVLDDQFNDVEQQQYKIVVRLSLAGMPCPRPAIVMLSSPPGSSIRLVIPK
ncbi:MAG: hypothetical protein WBE91_10940 [Steroidobacteraceae bacterium]